MVEQQAHATTAITTGRLFVCPRSSPSYRRTRRGHGLPGDHPPPGAGCSFPFSPWRAQPARAERASRDVGKGRQRRWTELVLLVARFTLLRPGRPAAGPRVHSSASSSRSSASTWGVFAPTTRMVFERDATSTSSPGRSVDPPPGRMVADEPDGRSATGSSTTSSRDGRAQPVTGAPARHRALPKVRRAPHRVGLRSYAIVVAYPAGSDSRHVIPECPLMVDRFRVATGVVSPWTSGFMVVAAASDVRFDVTKYPCATDRAHAHLRRIAPKRRRSSPRPSPARRPPRLRPDSLSDEVEGPPLTVRRGVVGRHAR